MKTFNPFNLNQLMILCFILLAPASTLSAQGRNDGPTSGVKVGTNPADHRSNEIRHLFSEPLFGTARSRIKNDAISSISVPSNYYVVLYANPGFTGSSRRLNGPINIKNLSSKRFNDVASSALVYHKRTGLLANISDDNVIVYGDKFWRHLTHSGKYGNIRKRRFSMRGRPIGATYKRRTIKRQDIWHGYIRSFQMGKNLEMTVYERENFKGKSKVIRYNDLKLTVDLTRIGFKNGVAKSFIIRKVK